MYSATLSLTSALDMGVWLMPRLGRFTPGKGTRYPLYRRQGGPQGRSGRSLNEVFDFNVGNLVLRVKKKRKPCLFMGGRDGFLR